MPYFNADSDAAWSEAYDPPYLRSNRYRIMGPQPARILAVMQSYGLLTTDPILVVGGGFGWMCEEWGLTNVAITDTSAYIQSRLGANAVLPILNNPLTTAPQRNAIRSTLGGTWPRWVITEDVVTGLLDAEISSLIGTANAIVDSKAGGGVIHLVTRTRPGDPPPAVTYNWKTLDQWSTFIAGIKGSSSPRHIMISVNHAVESREVL